MKNIGLITLLFVSIGVIGCNSGEEEEEVVLVAINFRITLLISHVFLLME